MACPFCPPRVEETNIVIESELSLFIQMPHPVLIGSGIIVPKAHREQAFDLTAEEWQDTYTMLADVKALLDREHHPQGYSVGWNCGEVGGQTVFHAHLHVIPRFEDEPYAGRGIRSWIKLDENKRPI